MTLLVRTFNIVGPVKKFPTALEIFYTRDLKEKVNMSFSHFFSSTEGGLLLIHRGTLGLDIRQDV